MTNTLPTVDHAAILFRVADLHRMANEVGLELIGTDLAPADLAIAREMLVAIGEDLATVRADISHALLGDTVDGEVFETPVGQFKNEPEIKRTGWDPNLLLMAVERLLVRHAGVREASARTIARWINVHAPFSPDWRVGKLRELGIDPADHCSEDKGRKITHKGTKDSVRRLLAQLGGANFSTVGAAPAAEEESTSDD